MNIRKENTYFQILSSFSYSQNSPINEAPSGMFVVTGEADMIKIHAVMTGSILQCPPNNPALPPKAYLITTCGGQVRYNPNLYRNGKVCLSILGTWNGLGWSPALYLLSVLLSIKMNLDLKNLRGLTQNLRHTNW